MSLNYLFGPVSLPCAENDLGSLRQAGNCLVFNAEEDADVRVAMGDSWADVCARFPPGWSADFVVLCAPFSAVPPCLLSAPVVRVALVSDCRACWHAYRRLLPAFHLVLADPDTADSLRAAGF